MSYSIKQILVMNINDFDKVCRTCMGQGNLTHINSSSDIKDFLETFMSLEISADDSMPKQICQKCYHQLDDFFLFRKQILSCEEEFRQIISKAQFLNEFNKSEQFGEYDNGKTDARSGSLTNGICDNKGFLLETDRPNKDPHSGEVNHINNQYRKKKLIVDFLCERCGRIFSSHSALIQHSRVHTGEKPFSCDICNRKFARTEHLKQHKRTHTGEKPHKCSDCLKEFAQISALIAHNRTHSGEKPHVCSICSKAFAQSISLTYHIRTHTGEAPYKCEVCGKCFVNSGNLNIHRRFHNNERPFNCDLCPKSFVTVSHLKVHVNRHKGIKSHRCEVCQKAFVRSTHLKEHMVMHTGNKPYVCDLCPKRYSQSGHLNRHRKSHRNKVNE